MKWNLIEVELAWLARPVRNAVLPCLAWPDDNLIDSVSIIVIGNQYITFLYLLKFTEYNLIVIDDNIYEKNLKEFGISILLSESITEFVTVRVTSLCKRGKNLRRMRGFIVQSPYATQQTVNGQSCHIFAPIFLTGNHAVICFIVMIFTATLYLPTPFVAIIVDLDNKSFCLLSNANRKRSI